MLGPQAPGDVGYYTVDWSAQLAAVQGDSITGNLTVECTSPDIAISNVTLAGAAAVTFNAESDIAAVYSLVARAEFTPSGRRLSQRIELAVGEPPATEPISLDEARQHLRLDTSGTPPAHPDDLLVQGMITAARQYCEGETGLTMVTTQRTDFRDSWTESPMSVRWGNYPGLGDYLYHGDLQMYGRPAFLLEHAPVISVDEVRYLDPSGALQVLPADQYRTIPFGFMLRLEPLIGGAWPACYYGGHGVVQVDYTAGWNGPIEEGLRTAIKMMLTIYYENRGAFGPPAQIPQGVADMLNGYRVL
jgi:hypothetical protein